MSTFRGSLRACVLNCAEKFKLNKYPMLAIICVPRGKYYTVFTIEEIASRTDEDMQENKRMIFFGTEKELRTFCKFEQTELFGEKIDLTETENF